MVAVVGCLAMAVEYPQAVVCLEVVAAPLGLQVVVDWAMEILAAPCVGFSVLSLCPLFCLCALLFSAFCAAAPPRLVPPRHSPLNVAFF